MAEAVACVVVEKIICYVACVVGKRNTRRVFLWRVVKEKRSLWEGFGRI